MGSPLIPLACGCVWRGEGLDRGCVESERLREEMERLPYDGRAQNPAWYSLAMKLDREHAPEPVAVPPRVNGRQGRP